MLALLVSRSGDATTLLRTSALVVAARLVLLDDDDGVNAVVVHATDTNEVAARYNFMVDLIVDVFCVGEVCFNFM